MSLWNSFIVVLSFFSYWFFCVLKKWVHSKIGQCVRPSGRPSVRLHDYSWKAHSIVMKFSTQLYLINISLEFEDENNSSRICWVTPRNIIIFYTNIDLFQFLQIKIFCHSQNKTSTIIYRSIENFTGYKMMLNYRG